jgi:hypothetical protein
MATICVGSASVIPGLPALTILGDNAVAQISPDYWTNFSAMVVAFAFLALLIERALYQVFDSNAWEWLEKSLDKQVGGDYLDLKPWISVAVSIAIVFKFRLDMVAVIFGKPDAHVLSMLVTGLFVSGGSTGVYKFFKRARQLKDAMADQKMPPTGSNTGSK